MYNNMIISSYKYIYVYTLFMCYTYNDNLNICLDIYRIIFNKIAKD